MEPTSVFDAAKLLAAGGATIYVAVQMVKTFVGTSPRATVAAAIVFGFGLTALYAAGIGVLDVRHAFDLVVAAFTLAASGAGINAAANATAKG